MAKFFLKRMAVYLQSEKEFNSKGATPITHNTRVRNVKKKSRIVQ